MASKGARFVDVREDPTALEDLLKASKGRRVVPVIVDGEKVTIGYGGT